VGAWGVSGGCGEISSHWIKVKNLQIFIIPCSVIASEARQSIFALRGVSSKEMDFLGAMDCRATLAVTGE
jgi:hypothetical protein